MTRLDRAAIEALIPHRDPFLLIDRVSELEPGVRAVAGPPIYANRYANAGATGCDLVRFGAKFRGNASPLIHPGATANIVFKTAAFDRSATPPEQ